MKRSELFFNAIKVPADFLMILLASISAFFIREHSSVIELYPKLYKFSFEQYLTAVLIVAPFFLLIFALEGLYDVRLTRKLGQEIMAVSKAMTIGLVIVIITVFLERDYFSSRFIILTSWILIIIYVVFLRILLRSVQRWLLINRGVGVHRVLLIGTTQRAKRLKREIRHKPTMGYRVIGIIDDGSISRIRELRKEKGVDEIILCDSSVTENKQAKLIDYCEINNITYKYLPTSLQTNRFVIGMLNGEPIVEVLHTPLDGWGKIAKRIFDILGSVFLIILFSPLMLVVALLIKLESRGPIIYKSERIGADGIKFYAYKFRYLRWEYSISDDNPNTGEALKLEKELIKKYDIRKGPLYKIKDDPRKTKIGTWIERYSVDELPQFFNVLKGNMSLVGPRPHQEREVEQYSEYHRRLLTIKPGITGMGQVSGRSDLQFEDEYRYDVYYIENWSLLLDLIICFKTLSVVIARRNN